jgi:hypothetical protein
VIGNGDAVFRASVGGQFFFQFRDFRAKDILAVGQYTRNGGVDLGFDARLLGLEVYEVNHGLMLDA